MLFDYEVEVVFGVMVVSMVIVVVDFCVVVVGWFEEFEW